MSEQENQGTAGTRGQERRASMVAQDCCEAAVR